MLRHGYSAKDVVFFSIIFIRKDLNLKVSLRNSNDYKGMAIFISKCKIYNYAVKHICDNLMYYIIK